MGEQSTMKRKMITIIFFFALAVTGTTIFVISSNNEKNKKSTFERYQEREQKKEEKQASNSAVVIESSNNQESSAGTSPADDKSVESTQENLPDENSAILEVDGVRYEFLGYEIIKDTDMVGQTKYPKENFHDEKFDPLEKRKEVKDMDKIREEAFEYIDRIENPDKYKDEDQSVVIELYKKYLPVIEKYTSYIHLESEYIFVKCRIKILERDDKSDEESMEVGVNNLDILIVNHNNIEETNYPNYPYDQTVYFDKAVYVNGEDRKSYFYVPLKYGEEIECTIGFEAVRHFDEQDFYIGVLDLQLYDDEHVSLAYEKNKVNLKNIKEGIE
jgi:hypothetical protein